MAVQHRHGPAAPLDCVIIRASSSCNHRWSSGHGPPAWRSSSMRWPSSWLAPWCWVMLRACVWYHAESRVILVVDLGNSKSLTACQNFHGLLDGDVLEEWGGSGGLASMWLLEKYVAELESCGGNVGGNCTAFPFPSTHLDQLASLHNCTCHFDRNAMVGWCKDFYSFIQCFPSALTFETENQIHFRRRIKKTQMKGVQSLIGCFWPLCGAGGGGSAI